MVDPMTISVKPMPGGWSVECDKAVSPQIFRGGGAAERSAVRLAAAFAKCGHGVRVVVLDRRGAVAGALDVSPYDAGVLRWRRALH